MVDRFAQAEVTPTIAWLIEWPDREESRGDKVQLTFVDPTDPEFWGGQRPPGVYITPLAPASDDHNARDIAAWLVQHSPFKGRSRYLTHTNPSDPQFWVDKVPGSVIITPLVPLPHAGRSTDIDISERRSKPREVCPR